MGHRGFPMGCFIEDEDDMRLVTDMTFTITRITKMVTTDMDAATKRQCRLVAVCIFD